MLSLGAIFLISGISTSFGFSPLLANMAMGFVVAKLIFLAKPMFPPATFDLLLSAMLASLTLSEIISPPLVRWALTRADET